jgi:hypothetical protein
VRPFTSLKRYCFGNTTPTIIGGHLHKIHSDASIIQQVGFQMPISYFSLVQTYMQDKAALTKLKTQLPNDIQLQKSLTLLQFFEENLTLNLSNIASIELVKLNAFFITLKQNEQDEFIQLFLQKYKYLTDWQTLNVLQQNTPSNYLFLSRLSHSLHDFKSLKGLMQELEYENKQALAAFKNSVAEARYFQEQLNINQSFFDFFNKIFY